MHFADGQGDGVLVCKQPLCTCKQRVFWLAVGTWPDLFWVFSVCTVYSQNLWNTDKLLEIHAWELGGASIFVGTTSYLNHWSEKD